MIRRAVSTVEPRSLGDTLCCCGHPQRAHDRQVEACLAEALPEARRRYGHLGCACLRFVEAPFERQQFELPLEPR